MSRLLRFWFLLFTATLMPSMSLSAQSWSAGKSLPISGVSIHAATVANIVTKRSVDVVAATDTGLWLLSSDQNGGLKQPLRLLSRDAEAVVAAPFFGMTVSDILMIPAADDGNLYLYPNQGNGVLGAPTLIAMPRGMSGTCSLASGDMNADGSPDVVLVCSSHPGLVYVGLNDGAGQFVFSIAGSDSDRSIISIAIGNFDDDNHNDIAFVSVGEDGTRRGDVLWGVDGKSFDLKTDVFPSDTQVVTAGDYDGDTRTELLTLAESGGHAFQASTQRTFKKIADFKPSASVQMTTIALAALQRGSSTPSVLALDLLGFGICNGLPQASALCVSVLTNTSATALSITPQRRKTDDKYSFVLRVKALHDPTPLSGEVLVLADRGRVQRLTLVDGQTEFKTDLSKGLHTIAAVYDGKHMLASSSNAVMIHVSQNSSASVTAANVYTNKQGKTSRILPALLPAIFGGRTKPRILLVGGGQPYNVSGITVTPGTTVNAGTSLTFEGDAQNTVGGSPSNGGFFSCGVDFASTCFDTPGWLSPDQDGFPQFWVDGAPYTGAESIVTNDNPVVCGEDDTGRDMFCDNYTEVDTFSITLAPGNHTVEYQYVADAGNLDGATSSRVLTQTVSVRGKLTPSISVSASPSTVSYGSGAAFTANLSGGASPTGNVTFFVDGSSFSTVALSGSSASTSVGGGWGAGGHTITATYNGDNSNNSVSASTGLTINKVTPSIGVTCGPNPITFGSATTCTESQSAGTGTVAWTINGAGWTNTGVGGSAGGFNGSGAGTYVIGVSYSGDGNYNATSSSTTLTINRATPSTSVSCGPNPITFGTATTCTESQSGGSGTVAWTINGTPWTGTAVGGSAGGFNSSSVGSYNIGVSYSGDGNYNATSASTTLTINKATPSVIFSISPNPITYGQSSTTSVQVGCNSACGLVDIRFDGGEWETIALGSTGNSSAPHGPDPAGTHAIQVNYLGDGNYNAVTTSVQTLTINKATPSLSVNCTTVTYGEPTSCSVHVSAGTGSVAFTNDGVLWGTVGLDASGNAVGVGTAAAGNHTMVATYSGDNNYSSVSETAGWSVNKAPVSWEIAVSPSPANLDNAVTMTMQPCAASGTMTFFADTQNLGTVPLTPGACAASQISLTTTSIPAGNHSITAVYSGDDNYLGGTQGPVSLFVFSPTVSRLSATPSNGSYGVSVALSTLINTGGVQPTGEVNFLNGTDSLGSGAISSVQTTNLIPYSNTFTQWPNPGTVDVTPAAATGPDGTQSASLIQVKTGHILSEKAPCSPGPVVSSIWVQQDSSNPENGFVLSMTFLDSSANVLLGTSSSAAPTNNWQRVSYVSTAPTGTASCLIQLGLGNVRGGSAAGSGLYIFGAQLENAENVGPYVKTTASAVNGFGGIATLNTRSLPVGSDSITAVYGGDINTLSSTSAAVIAQITQATPSLTLTSSSSPSVFNESVTWSCTASSDGSPVVDGTVLGFSLDGAQLSSAATSNGIASWTSANLTAGTHTISCSAGDADYEATSVDFSQVVNKATPTVTWSQPASITYGTPLSATQLNATENIAGSNVYSSALGTVLNAGPQLLFVSFTPTDTANYTTTTDSVQIMVSKASPGSGGIAAVTVASNNNPSIYEDPVKFTAIVPDTATGTVQFMDGAVSLGTSRVFGNKAVLVTTSLLAGSHPITAVYSGDTNFNGATSAALAQAVNKATPGSGGIAAVSLASSLNPSIYEQSVTFTATPPTGATGTVQFLDGTTSLGSSPIDASNKAVLVTTSLLAGSHPITAVYSGDANFNGATSAALAQVVNKATPGSGGIAAASLASSLNPSIYEQPVTFTTTLPRGATGTVQFLDGTTSLGSSAVDSSSTAKLMISTLVVGSHPITAVYSGDANFNGATSAALAQVVNKATPGSGGIAAASLASSLNPSIYEQPVTFTTTLPRGATGTVQFMDGTTLLGSAPVDSSSTAKLAISTLVVGTHPITAVYSGDANFNGATSAALAQIVNKATPGSGGISAASLASSSNPSLYEQPVTFVATLPTGATGIVQFMDGVTSLGSSPIDASSTAKLTISTLVVGYHPITAVFSGDANFNGATSAALAQIVNKATPGSGGIAAVSLASSSNPSIFEQPVTFTATVPTGATGVVQFLDGTTSLGSSAVDSSSRAKLTTSTLVVGSHPITAVYGGDASFNGATSAALSQAVNKGTPGSGGIAAVSLASSSNPSIFEQTVTFTATVPIGATGTVQFMDGSISLGSFQIDVSSESKLIISTLVVGSHPITAIYSGDGNFNGGISAVLNQMVNKATPGSGGIAPMTVASNSNPSFYLSAVLFTATVPASATGTVEFMDGSTSLGSSPIDATTNKAEMATSKLLVGSHLITAIYSGDASFDGGTSAVLTQVVNKAALGVNVATSLNPAIDGQTVTFTATVPTDATGMVQFMDASNVLGSSPISGGTASFATTNLAVGDHSITAVYGGDSAYKAATSVQLDQIVIYPGAPDFTISSTGGGTIAAGEDLTAGLTVKSINGFSGTVTFSCTKGVDPTMGCVFAPVSIAPEKQSASSLTVTTVGLSVVTVSGGLLPLLLGILMPRTRKRKGWHLAFAVMACVALLANMEGCGASKRYIQSNGTPAGTYNVVVTGSSGAITHTTVVAVTVK